jgi:hypothetical protein
VAVAAGIEDIKLFKAGGGLSCCRITRSKLVRLLRFVKRGAA